MPTTLTGENILAGEFVSLFFWQNIYGSFSFFEWLIYPVAGLLFGLLLRRCLDKKRFYIHLLICSLLIIGIIFGIAKLMNYNIHDNFYGSDSVYYLQTYPKVLLNFAVIGLTISICFFYHTISFSRLCKFILQLYKQTHCSNLCYPLAFCRQHEIFCNKRSRLYALCLLDFATYCFNTSCHCVQESKQTDKKQIVTKTIGNVFTIFVE